MTDEELRSRIIDASKDVLITVGNTDIFAAARNVMDAYQKANKWLDIIKEYLLMVQGCVFFSNYIHALAHTMPIRFDKFGDILHTADMTIPYPATEYISNMPTDMTTSFQMIFTVLDNISDSLFSFIKCTEGSSGSHAMACSAEELLLDIKSEYPSLYLMRKVYFALSDTIKFDKWVGQYVAGNSKLI